MNQLLTNTRHTDLKDHNITNIRFLQMTQPVILKLILIVLAKNTYDNNITWIEC